MAKAAWNATADEFNQWDETDAEEKIFAIDGIRAALLSLASQELPLIALHNGLTAFEEHRYAKGGDADDALHSAFSAILRSIAA